MARASLPSTVATASFAASSPSATATCSSGCPSVGLPAGAASASELLGPGAGERGAGDSGAGLGVGGSASGGSSSGTSCRDMCANGRAALAGVLQDCMMMTVSIVASGRLATSPRASAKCSVQLAAG